MSTLPDSALAQDSNKPLPQDRLQYLRMYRYVFESPQWLANFGWALLAAVSTAVIPIVGQLVLVGYLYEIVEMMHRYPGRVYPSFDIHRFTDYLSRSIWPFLVSLILTIPLVGVFVVMYIGGFVAVMVAVESDDAAIQAIMTAVVAIVILLAMAFILLVNVVIMPFMLQAGLARNLSSEGGLCFRRAKQMIRLTWLEILLGSLFISVSSIPLAVLGLLCCYVGVFIPATWISFASIHLQYQIYEIHLARGGEPVPLVEPPRPPDAITADLA